MLRVGVGEAQAAVEIALMPDVLGLARERLLVTAVGEDCGVGGLGGALVGRIVVGGTFVFVGRLGEVLALVEDFREQEVGLGAVGLVREVGEELAVPARRELVIGALAVALRLGVEVLREITVWCSSRGLRSQNGWSMP